MNANLLQSIAVERVMDMRTEATTGSAVRRARFARAGRRAGAARSGAAGRLVRRTVHP